MKKIHAAYKLGAEGKPSPEGAPRLQRLAHRIGHRGLANTVAINAELDTRKKAEFDETVASAQGFNKQALQIIEEAAQIPGDGRPFWAPESIDSDGNRSKQWIASFSSGKDQDPSRPNKTPLVASLGTLHVDIPNWAHNGITMTIDNFAIESIAPIGDDGHIEPASTTLYFNSRPYEADGEHLTLDNSVTGGAKIVIDSTGGIVELGLTRGNNSGYVNEDPRHVQTNLGAFLEGAKAAVNQTAQAYQDLSTSLSN